VTGRVTGSGDGGRHTAFVVIGLLLLTAAVYGRVGGFGFVSYDDDLYLTANQVVREGLTLSGAAWAMTAFHAANWHPLTWLSLMLDVSLFGARPGPIHLANVGWHAAAAVLLFVVLRGMTGALWMSALAAALFAVHPLHVESVAWVAERKDVLSGFFFMLVLGAYLGHVRRPGPGRYALTALSLGLGLMAKPMLVTVPPLLLLLDWWPLGRLGTRSGGAVPVRRVLIEKVPLLAMAAISAALTMAAQSRGGAIAPMEGMPWVPRFGNALVAMASYLDKTFRPVGLAVFYPHQGVFLEGWRMALSAVVVVGVTVAALALRRRSPAATTGWLWFCGMLVPVLGLVQAGGQAMADRYTYLPLVGIFVALVWSARAVVGNPARRGGAALLALAILAVLSTVAFRQTGFWRDSRSLFTRAVDVTKRNWLAHNSLGAVLAASGETDEAVRHFRESIRIAPGHPKAHYNLGVLQAGRGRWAEGEAHLKRALELNPGYTEALLELAASRERRGDLAGAQAGYGELLRRRPDDPRALLGLGSILGRRGRTAEALPLLDRAVALDPGSVSARLDRGNTRLAAGRPREAEEDYRAALVLDPSLALARNNLGVILLERGDRAGAVEEFRRAVALDPGSSEARANLARAGAP
jgi:tetratricopeptide (TPR) repeat protein